MPTRSSSFTYSASSVSGRGSPPPARERKMRASFLVHLGGLIAEERVDVRVAAVRAYPARDHERLDPRRGVAGRAAPDANQMLELLLLVRLVERRALHRA